MRRTAPLTAAALFAALCAAPGAGQASPQRVEIDPELPIKRGFDIERAYIGRAPLFQPLHDPAFTPLREARREGRVGDDSPILVFEAGGRTLSLVTAQMSYHHVAQGEMAGEPWMVTF